MKKLIIGLLSIGSLVIFKVGYGQQAKVDVNISQELGQLPRIWSWFGYDEPNYTYMKDGKKLLTELSELSPVPVYVRTHSLLVTGDGTAALKWGSTNIYTEDSQGNPVYNWNIVDSIFDTYVKRGMKPLAEIGFMPEALSSHPEPYRHHWKPGDKYSDIITGWAYPPKDYNKWAELIYQWVKHCVSRYGAKEVSSWYWEVWNEADGYYWKGTQEEFFKLYDYTASAVKRALPTARIGGPNTTGGAMKWLDAFLKHCQFGRNYATGKIGAPLDAILFHAKGSPRLKNGTVVMGISSQLHNVENNFKVIKQYPALKDLPVILGENDPEGCAACGMATDPQNAYRNGTMYSSYTAASFARIHELAVSYNVHLIGAVTWAFEFENQPWFYGFRDLATNGVDKPVLNVFRMFGKMGTRQVFAQSDHQYALQDILKSGVRGAQTDIGVLASRTDKSASVLLWNYHDKDTTSPARSVLVTVNGAHAKSAALKIYIIDRKHNNAYALWKKMGSPQNPSATQIAELTKTGQLTCSVSKEIQSDKGAFKIPVTLQRQAVALLCLYGKDNL
ncbi:beta-xylosidase [Arachidicoccus ginsenosidivorans]|uniref:Beta-xylosidase n=1 Tax=Arachidicoccus ginsenosidivorans TaxID=496057 RepID=A0A5B8VMF3_9BACT|nr:beta-xylosidase [Arachidicoccus ginsenosidivorans]QEC72155.1 beta-xylosidase [Arachidicoccus ginsenosidivorans]